MEADPGLMENSQYLHTGPRTLSLFSRVTLFLQTYPAVWVFGSLLVLYLIKSYLPALKSKWQKEKERRTRARTEALPTPRRALPGMSAAAAEREGASRDAQRLAWLEQQQQKYLEEARVKAAAMKEKKEKQQQEARADAVRAAGEQKSKKDREEPRKNSKGGGLNPLLSGSASMVGGFRSSRSTGGRGRGG